MNPSSTATSTGSRAFGAVASGVVFFFASFLASGPS
jgi:hypothetical protein